MTAKRCRTAGLDSAYDAQLITAEMTGSLLTISWPVAAKDISHLQRRPWHGPVSVGRHELQLEPIQRTFCGLDRGR